MATGRPPFQMSSVHRQYRYFVFSGLYCLPIFIAVESLAFQQPSMFIQKKQTVALHDLPQRNHVEVVVDGQRTTETEAGHA